MDEKLIKILEDMKKRIDDLEREVRKLKIDGKKDMRNRRANEQYDYRTYGFKKSE